MIPKSKGFDRQLLLFTNLLETVLQLNFSRLVMTNVLIYHHALPPCYKRLKIGVEAVLGCPEFVGTGAAYLHSIVRS